MWVGLDNVNALCVGLIWRWHSPAERYQAPDLASLAIIKPALSAIEKVVHVANFKLSSGHY